MATAESNVRSKSLRTAVLLLLLVTSFTLTWRTSARLYALRTFAQYNVLFDSDPNYYLITFSKGPFFFDYRHPALPALAHLPIAVCARALAALGLGAGSAEPLREPLTLLMVAVVAAARTLIWFTAFHRLLGRLQAAALLCIIDMFAASMVTIGSIPESYPFSAACLAAMFWLALDDGPRRPWVRPALWLTVATVAIGVTVTAVLSVAFLAAASLARRGYPLVRIAMLVVSLAGAATLVDGVLTVSAAWYFGYPLHIPAAIAAEGYVHRASPESATQLGWAVAHTFLAPLPGTGPVWKEPGSQGKFDFMFSYNPPFRHEWQSAWRAVTTAIVLLLGAAGLGRSRALRPILWGSGAIVAANLALHLFYGLYYTLFAPHWEPALLMIMAGAFLLPHRLGTAGNAAIWTFAFLTVASSGALLQSIFDRLAAA